MTCFDAGANMVSYDAESILKTLDLAVMSTGRAGGRYTCPYCDTTGLSERDMWYHCPAYHINFPNERGQDKSEECPICRERLRGPLQVYAVF